MQRIAVAGATGVAGRLVVERLRAAGHEVVGLSRSTGVDLTRTEGLAAAIEGCDAVVDVSSIGTLATKAATAFFGAVTRNLLAAERDAAVPHHVALSIVGAAEADSGYYAGKALQERLVMASEGWTLLRATQFHEFAAQTVARGAVLGVTIAPRMHCRPVAADEVAAALVDLATGAPRGLVPDLGGPRIEWMADLVRRYLRARGRRGPVLEVRLPGSMGRILADGRLIPGPDAVLGRETYDEWLEAIAVANASSAD